MSGIVSILKALWKAEEALFAAQAAPEKSEDLLGRVHARIDATLERQGAFEERLQELQAARSSGASLSTYVDHYGIAGLKRYKTASGRPVYRIVAETFPGHINNLYFLPQASGNVLIDAATTTETALRDLKRAERLLPDCFGQTFCIEDITDIVLTHGHIDHFGGLHALVERSKARVHIHELDFKSLAQFEERTVLLSKDLGVFLRRAGVSSERALQMEEMYRFGKAFFKDFEPQSALRDGDNLKGMRVIHTPGHCPGEVCLLYDDILFTGDHILPTITPHQSPEHIAPFCGLWHYIGALKRIGSLEGVRLGLGGHEGEIQDVSKRGTELLHHHQERLLEILRLFSEPRTVVEVTRSVYPMHSEGYNHLLALEEVGAHVEYLNDYGLIRIQNIETLLHEENPALVLKRTPKGEAFLEKPYGILVEKKYSNAY
jgi:glyoxylase-like metal-dependent hydrolase (beta-lactamase superfamily II)